MIDPEDKEALKRIAASRGMTPEEFAKDLAESAREVGQHLSEKTPDCIDFLQLDRLNHISDCKYCRWMIEVISEILESKGENK